MAELGSAFVRVVPDTTALNAQMGAYFTSSRWKGMGKAAGIALGAGLAAGGAVKGLYEIGEAFDDAYDKIRVATGKSGKDLGKLKRSFKDVVSDVPTDFDSASTAISGLSQRLGLTGKPLERLSKQMLELSRITDTDLGENVQSVTRLFGDWSIKTRDQTKTLDKLFRLSQASGIQVATLAELMTQFGSPLRQLGIDFDTAAAMFSRFEREGVNIQTLMPGLRFALKTLSGATPEVTAELKKLGIATGDPAKGLQQVFEKIEDAGSAAKANQLAFQVFGVRAGPDMAAAIREGRFELDDLIRAMDDGSDTIRKAGRETMDFGEQLTLLKNNVFVALEPVARRVFGAIGDEARRLRKILTDKDLTGAEKFQAVLEELGRIAHKYGPKIAEAGGKIGIALLKGIADAFVHSNVLGKLFIGGAFLRLLGGPGVFGSLGAKLAGWLFAGFGSAAVGASGAGAGAAGGAAAGAASSLAAGLRTMIGRAGIVGLGVMAGSSLMKGISDGIVRSSGDVQEALEASIPSGDITKNILGWNGPGIIESIFGASDETKHFEHIRDTLNHILKARVGISEEAKAAVMDEGRLVGLTDKQLGQAERVLDYGTERLNQAEQLRDVFKNANIDLTGEDLLPQATVDQVTARMTQMRKGMFTAASQIQKVMAENRKNIRSLGLPAEQTRKMLTSNMRAGAKAMREALRNGSIKGVEHIREARKKIKHLLRSADLVEGIHPRDFGRAFAEAIKAAGGATKDGIRKIVRDLMKMPKDARNAAFQTMMAQLREYKRGGKLSDKEFKDIRAKLLTRLQGITSDGREQSIRFRDIVSGNFGSLATSIWNGLQNIGTNVGKVLDSFQVKWQKYSLEKPKSPAHRQHGGLVPGLTKGALVPGTGSGDKVPLHIGGQLAAYVEPGELVSVTNRTATAALMAHNRRVPRRAQGGMVDPAGPGTGLVNEAIAGIVGRWSQRFNAAINYGYDPGGGHLSPGHNVTGTATDTGPAGGWGAGPTRLFEQGLKLLLGSGLTVLYGSHGIGTPYRNHGYGNHAHIEWGMHPVIKGLGAAAAETIKRILLKGPKGPLRDMGQSALDKTRKAASAYLAKHSGGMMGGDIGAPIRSLPEALQKYNRTYAEHNSAEGDWGGYRMPFNAVAALAEWAGAPGVSMARTAIGESNLRPGATGVDRGGTKGYGLWMITTSFNDDLVKPYGGYGQMLNPVLNAQVMSKILDRQGYGAWYSDTLDTSGTHYSGPLLRKYGGLVPHLAKGGKAGDKDLHGTATPGPVTNAFKRFRKARRIAKQLKDLLGERGRVARVDERIAGAEALAGLASSEAGSEMSPKELARQIRLNELLLANLVKARKLARSGLGLTRWPKGMSVDKRTEKLMKGLAAGFQSNLVDLTGLTGSGGRIFETKNIIDELKHTTGAGPAALDISGLRSVIEAARYGVFDGYFARGGNLKPGRWGIAGERGPEVVHGPSTVLSPRATQDVLAPKVEVHNEFDFDGLDLYVTTKVNGEIAKRERVNHRRGRQAVR